MTSASATDVARAARLVAAVSAGDDEGVATVIGEAKGHMIGLVIAVATRHVQLAAEYYDTDRQAILDRFAFDAISFSQNADGGDLA